MPKIYISPENRVAPHGKYWGQDNIYENAICVDIATKVNHLLTKSGFDVKQGVTGVSIRERVAEAIDWDADYYLPIHTNACTSGDKEGTAQGPTVLYCGEKGSVSYNACNVMYKRLMEIYPYPKNRGIVPNTTFYEINSTPMLSVYPECAFHDNAKDADWLVNNTDKIATAIATAVCDWYGRKLYNATVDEANTADTDNIDYKQKYFELVQAVQDLYDKLEKGVE